MLHYRLSSKQ